MEEARRKKELMEAEELMRMQSLKKTWLRAIQDEPSELGIDSGISSHMPVSLHSQRASKTYLFGLTIIMLILVFGPISNKALATMLLRDTHLFDGIHVL